ncbi:MFS transporter [Candidatus Kaiserbacteria bacterium]|nr:MFS transporter [Candidatus Kaiserbacteria bacterium]
MDAIRAFGEQTFSSLKIRNYRLYFIGQGLSDIGTWMQVVAIGWLVLELTGSGIQLGSVLAFRFAPMLALGVLAGSVVDSFDKRVLLYITQSIGAFVALSIGVLVLTESITLPMVYLAALVLGLADVFDRPARQTFVHEVVGPENLRNAVSLGSARANLARALGPMFAGALIAGAGMALCFFGNALSYAVSLVALFLMRRRELHREFAEARKVSHIFSGLRYVASMPLIRTILISMAVVGTLSYEFQTTLPLLARTTFLGNAADYAALLSAMGAGSVAGGLFSASRKEVGAHEFVFWAFLFGVSICATAFMPSLPYAVLGMVFVGFFSICLSTTGNTMIQLESASHMRGRVMSLWSMALFGSTLIGAPIVGLVGEHISPRWALALGGVAAIVAALFASRRLLKSYQFFSIPSFISIRREEETVVESEKV